MNKIDWPDIIMLMVSMFIVPYLSANIEKHITKLNAKLKTAVLWVLRISPYLYLLCAPTLLLLYYLNTNPTLDKKFVVTIGLICTNQAVGISLAIVFFMMNKYTKVLQALVAATREQIGITVGLTKTMADSFKEIDHTPPKEKED